MKGKNTDSGNAAYKLTVEDILYEDNHIIVLNKRSSQIVQGDKTGDVPLSEIVKEYLKAKYSKPGEVFLGVVHRLDRPVSGAVIFARTSKALTRLNAMVKNREIKKTYWAVVKNRPPKDSDILTAFLYRDESKNKSFVVGKSYHGAQSAELTYKVLMNSDLYYLLEIDLKTGRHHQIRAQLAGMGCPIKGDLKYGFDRSNPDASIHLHARKLEFVHPVSKEPLEIIAPVPQENLWSFFEKHLPC